MTKSQVLAAIRLMPTIERLEIIEFATQLMREEIIKNGESAPVKQLSLVAAAEIMHDFYAEGSNLTEFTDLSPEDFYEYENYA
jgi:hypothetical protein